MKIVIIGCTHAGTMAALQILKNHPDTELTIYERDTNIAFLSCGIYLYLGGKVHELEDMFYSSPEELSRLGANIKTRHDVLKIDSKNKTLRVANMVNGDVFNDCYDKLIMTTGSSVQVPPIRGIDQSKVLLCKTYDQAKEIYETAKENKRIAIVGGGYVGVELAESYANTHHVVTLFQSDEQVLGHYVSGKMAQRIERLLLDHHVEVKLNHSVTAFSESENGELVVETNHGNFFADLAIVGTGFVPNTALLRGQVDMDNHGAIIVDDYVRTSNSDIYSAGDACVANYNPTGESVYLPLASSAVRQGTLAGTNVFGDIQRYMGTQASSGMQLFDYTLATTGLTYEVARKKFVTRRVLFEGELQNIPVSIELVYDQNSRKILGVQLWSQHEVAQSANAMSIAIQNGNTIDDIAAMSEDWNLLGYAVRLAVEQETRSMTSFE